MKFKDLRLWQHALAARENDPHNQKRELLRSSYLSFWQNGCTLLREIAKDVPNITLHDENHLEALWARADQIAGPNLNPVEVFVFGGAVLLHDMANCVAVFKGGISEIKKTPEWADAAAEISDSSMGASLTLEQEKDVLFSTLRILHANKAEKLGKLSFSKKGTRVSLIENDTLREHLGSEIGLIAASHGWDISELPVRLRRNVGALGGYPQDWTVRSILIACLLRCADATQIDQERCPDFLYTILKLEGMSEAHWISQRKIATPGIDPNDSSAMIFTSTDYYGVAEARAWWISYEAIGQAHKELQSCKSLLNDLGLPLFAINSIRGAYSPLRLAKDLQVKGWKPILAEVKVKNVKKIIEMFGGAGLYGKQPQVALRELIQNAVDAIAMRKQIGGEGDAFAGKVTVSLRRGSDGIRSGYWLKVQDNGIGMSDLALTGPLIDFGGSYTTSQIAKIERPGAISKSNVRTGQYGIGFFAVFMLSDRVLVTSRPFDRGQDNTHILSFEEGMITRPLLLDGSKSTLSTTFSTEVALFVEESVILRFLNWSKNEEENINFSMRQIVSALCPLVDVDIFVEDELSEHKNDLRNSKNQDDRFKNLAHSGEWWKPPRKKWLSEITGADIFNDHNQKEIMEKYVNRMKFIDPREKSAGLAALAVTGSSGEVRTVGGFRPEGFANPVGRRPGFIGAIDFFSAGPRRSPGKVRAHEKVTEWAKEQIEIIRNSNEEKITQFQLAMAAASFGADPLNIAGAFLDKKPSSISDIVELLSTGAKLFAIVRIVRRKNNSINLAITPLSCAFSSVSRTSDDLSPMPGLIEPLSMDIDPDWYFSVEEQTLRGRRNSFMSCLVRFAESKSKKLRIEYTTDLKVATYVGLGSERDGIVSGQDLIANCLTMAL